MSLLGLFALDWTTVVWQAVIWFVVFSAIYVWFIRFKKKVPWGLLQTLGLLLFAAFLLALIPNLKFGTNDGTGSGDISKPESDKPGGPGTDDPPSTKGQLTIKSMETSKGTVVVLTGPGGEKNTYLFSSEEDKLKEKIDEYAKSGVDSATIETDESPGHHTLGDILRDAGIKKVNTK